MNIKTVKVGSLKTNCYLVYEKSDLLIIDPGAEAEKVIKEIEKLSSKPKGIINTHSHFDHTGANKAIEEYFNVPVLNPPEKSIITIGESKLKVLKTPGHKEDSISLLGGGLIFVGDLLFKESTGRVDLPGGSLLELRKSLKKISKKITSETIIYPGHGDSFVLKNKDSINKYL